MLFAFVLKHTIYGISKEWIYSEEMPSNTEGVERRMARKHALLLLPVALLIGAILTLSVAVANDSVAFSSQDKGVVDKTPDASFTATITFQNTGLSEGTWSVNVAFEGDSWSWHGAPKSLTLSKNEKKTLVWNGLVPSNAAINSVARLIVYYDDSYTALDWWIHVVPASELTIKDSSVS